MPTGRIVVIPFLQGKLTADGTLVEPDIDAVLEKWLERHSECRGREFHTIRAKTNLPDGTATDLVRVTTDFCADLEHYDPAEDADLYEDFLAESDDSPPPMHGNIWIEQYNAARQIEDEFGTQKALDYLVGEKFLNFLEAAETNADFRAEIPAFVIKVKTMFERWQLIQYLATGKKTEPWDPSLFEPKSHPLLGEEEIAFDAEEIEEMRKDDIRQCTRDLLLMERAREWLLEDEKTGDDN